MNNTALIENRKSIREYKTKEVPSKIIVELQKYFETSCERLVKDIETRLSIFGKEAQAALEGAAGYDNFLVGSPNYMVLLSDKTHLAVANGGYMMEDMILKLTDMDLGSCWISFTDSDKIKAALNIQSHMEVVAIAAFGYPVKTTRRLRVNILSMSNVDIEAKRHYFDPKIDMRDFVFMETYGNTFGVDKFIGFYDDRLWEAFYSATLSPSYLNRQPYCFIIKDNTISLVKKPDEFTGYIDEQLGLGVVLLHFNIGASQWGQINWKFDDNKANLELPDGFEVFATCEF